MKSHYRTDFYRSNRDYRKILNGDEDEDGGEEDGEDDVLPKRSVGKSTEEKDPHGRERQEYLERRAKLKELERQKLKSKWSSDIRPKGSPNEELVAANTRSGDDGQYQEKRRQLPYNNYGSFFGPSEPVVARRIIEEARAREEAELFAMKLASKAPEKSVHKEPSGASRPLFASKPVCIAPVEEERPKAEVETALRLQRLKEARDYSFLFSDEDPQISIPENKPTSAARQGHEQSKQNASKSKTNLAPSRKGSVPFPSKSSSSVSNANVKGPGLQVASKGTLNSNKQVKPTGKFSKPTVSASVLKPTLPSGMKAPPNKLISGPGRPSQDVSSVNSRVVNGKKSTLPSINAKQVSTAGRPLIGSKDRMNRDTCIGISERRADSVSAPHKATAMGNTEQRRTSVDRVEQKKSTTVYRPEQRAPVQAAMPSKLLSQSKPSKFPTKPGDRRNERGRARESDSEDSFLDDDEEETGDVRSMIRKMFGYNPNKYRDIDDEDDRDMEVSFSRIQAEERRSARIAREEDERELALIEAEERAERAAKKRKSNHK
eukprot:c20805_g1_i1 orf=631-2268(-)